MYEWLNEIYPYFPIENWTFCNKVEIYDLAFTVCDSYTIEFIVISSSLACSMLMLILMHITAWTNFNSMADVQYSVFTFNTNSKLALLLFRTFHSSIPLCAISSASCVPLSFAFFLFGFLSFFSRFTSNFYLILFHLFTSIRKCHVLFMDNHGWDESKHIHPSIHPSTHAADTNALEWRISRRKHNKRSFFLRRNSTTVNILEKLSSSKRSSLNGMLFTVGAIRYAQCCLCITIALWWFVCAQVIT